MLSHNVKLLRKWLLLDVTPSGSAAKASLSSISVTERALSGAHPVTAVSESDSTAHGYIILRTDDAAYLRSTPYHTPYLRTDPLYSVSCYSCLISNVFHNFRTSYYDT